MVSAETRKPEVQSPARDFDNFTVLHGLALALRDLDSRKREALQEMVTKFRFPTYIAPEGHCIEIEPNYAKSREVPLDVEVFDDTNEDWHGVHRDSEAYDDLVSFYREFEPYFVGQSIEQEDSGDGAVRTYVYNSDHNARVQVTHETVFRLVDLPQ